jgi:hypothetical protein
MKRKFILASVVSLTLAGMAPVALAQRDGRDGRFSDRYEVRVQNRVDYNTVPGDVKRAIEPQLNSGDKVTDVYTYKRGDRTIYVATTNDERIIRADDRGNLLGVRSTDDEADRDRKPVKYAGLPGDVKNTLGKEARGHPMEIFQVTRDGKTFYVANVEEAEGTRRIRVDADGKLVGQPVLLSDRGDDRARDRDRRDDLDARRRADRDRYNAEGEKYTFENLPGDVKQTVGAEMGQDKVTDVVKVKRDGKVYYRVDIESETRARTIWVEENGKLARELNDTEEGRVRVQFNDLPGNVKSAMIKEAHNAEPSRVWQVTRGRETWYVGEAGDGHLVRIDAQGRVMSHDTHPNLLSDRNDNRNRDNRNANDNRNNNANDNRNREISRDNANDNRNRDNARDDERNRNRERLTRRDFDKDNDGKIDGELMRFGELPNDVKQAVRAETRAAQEFKGIYKIKRDNGSVNYLVEMENDRLIRFGENGTVLGDSRDNR